MNLFRFSLYVTVLLVLMLAGTFVLEPTQDNRAAPNRPPDTSLSSTLPDDVPLNEPGDPEKDRRAFNDFAWREFIALNWPAVEGVRGKPDQNIPFGGKATSVVWESWKSVDELFPPEPTTHPPTPWDSFDAVIAADHRNQAGELTLHQFPEIPTKDAGRKRVLSHITRLALAEQADANDTQIGPLVAQNGTYVRYEIRVNKAPYEFLRILKCYLSANLPNGANPPTPARRARRVPFPCGSVVIKAAWMELTDQDDRKKFYHTQAILIDLKKDSPPIPRKAIVGLVGLHIAHKTPTRPSWVWATFEHIDNTEPASCPSTGRASFSRNDPSTANDGGFDNKPNPIPAGTPPLANPTPVDVLRISPIHPITQTINIYYHKNPLIQQTIWRYYQLVATQWVPAPDSGNPAVFPLSRFPTDYVANTTIETYRQNQSCIQCHISANDFQFIFFPTNLASPRPKMPP